MEKSVIYRNDNGTEVELKIKAECSTEKEMAEALSFLAQSARQFYLEAAEEIKQTL